MAEGYTAFGQVVGRHFQGDFIAGKDANAVAAETACKVG